MTGFLYSQSVIANCQDYMLLCMSLSLSVDEDNLKASLSLRRFFQLLPTKQLNPGDIFTQKKTFFLFFSILLKRRFPVRLRSRNIRSLTHQAPILSFDPGHT